MAEKDSATPRAVALIGLLIGSGAALRGTLPPAGQPEHRQLPDAAAAPMLLVALVGSVAIVAAAVVNRMRNRRAVDRGIRELPLSPGGDLRRSAWRVLLIGLAVLAVWVLVIALLSRLAGQPVIGGPAPPVGGPVAPPATGDAPARAAPPAGGGPAPARDYLAFTALALLALTAAAGAVVAGRRGPAAGRPAAADDTEPRAAPDLARAAELGLAEIDRAGRDPRRAIIACYAVMERHLGQIPGAQPQACDTPTEVLARAVSHHALASGNAAALVALFAEARFSGHPMTERDRVQAVAILSRVLDELREPACG